ncbi:putative sensor protein [Shigella flexneri K-671]|nr:putative sensor protein [Shigella flexneri K-671]
MLLAVFDRAALMLICLFFLIRIRLFRELLHKSAHSPKELLAVTAIFSLFALFSTWSGVPVEGSLVNVRIIAVMSGGILFGPWVGIITGVIAGIHRYLIDIGGVTAIPCFITSILAGCISGWINLKIPKAQRWRWISPTKRYRCFAMSIASHYARSAKLSAMTFTPMRWRLLIPIMCWPMLAWVNITIRMAMTSLARLPVRR